MPFYYDGGSIQYFRGYIFRVDKLEYIRNVEIPALDPALDIKAVYTTINRGRRHIDFHDDSAASFQGAYAGG